MKSKLVFIILCCTPYILTAQNNKTTFGLQYKPIIPVSYFSSSHNYASQESYDLNLEPRYSNSFGMIVRYKITGRFSIETAINYTQRNYRLAILNNNIDLNAITDFGIRSYEIPIQLLTYVRASKYWYLNLSFGISHNILASDIFSNSKKNQNFFQNTYRRKGGYNALLANVGMEYRTENIGHFYFGASLHRPWEIIAKIYPEYDDNTNIFNADKDAWLDIEGNFVTIDFRYFFKE